MKSIIQNEKCCWFCQTTMNLHDHHIFYGRANRKLSEKDGMKVWLCYEHHEGQEGVHHSGERNRHLDLMLKGIAQEKWESVYGNRKQFIERYGKSYLW